MNMIASHEWRWIVVVIARVDLVDGRVEVLRRPVAVPARRRRRAASGGAGRSTITHVGALDHRLVVAAPLLEERLAPLLLDLVVGDLGRGRRLHVGLLVRAGETDGRGARASARGNQTLTPSRDPRAAGPPGRGSRSGSASRGSASGSRRSGGRSRSPGSAGRRGRCRPGEPARIEPSSSSILVNSPPSGLSQNFWSLAFLIRPGTFIRSTAACERVVDARDRDRAGQDHRLALLGAHLADLGDSGLVGREGDAAGQPALAEVDRQAGRGRRRAAPPDRDRDGPAAASGRRPRSRTARCATRRSRRPTARGR